MTKPNPSELKDLAGCPDDLPLEMYRQYLLKK